MLGQLSMPGEGFAWRYDTMDAPSSSPGTSVTPGYSSAEGNWVAIASAANIAQDVYGFFVEIWNLNTSGYNLNGVLDIGVDQAGGSSYTAVIEDILCGHVTAGTSANGVQLYFPLFIKAGSSVAVRGSTSYTSGTLRAHMVFFGQPSRPELVRVGQYCEGIGAVSSCVGVSFTPVSGSEGSWASLGTTTRPCWWAQLTASINNGTIAAQYTHVDLAIGNGTTYDIIIQNLGLYVYGTAEIVARKNDANLLSGHWNIPAGATLYVRGRCSTTPAAGYNARALLIGG